MTTRTYEYQSDFARRYFSEGKAEGEADALLEVLDTRKIAVPAPPADEVVGHHWLLVRRNITDGVLACYRCWSPEPTTLAALVRVAGTRWCVEECFQAAKGEVGLDQHQVRRWRSWYRYTTLVMLAHAILAVIAAHERDREQRDASDLIPLSVNEIRHLFAKLITNTIRTISYRLRWSTWRRQHQTRTRTSHYVRRGSLIDSHPSP
jgi:hypothetical protein